jgi:hypothetical protein
MPDSNMPDSKEIQRKIRDLLLDIGDEQLGNEQLSSILEESFSLWDERHQLIDDTLEEMLQEVDSLLERMDRLDDLSLEDVDQESSAR